MPSYNLLAGKSSKTGHVEYGRSSVTSTGSDVNKYGKGGVYESGHLLYNNYTGSQQRDRKSLGSSSNSVSHKNDKHGAQSSLLRLSNNTPVDRRDKENVITSY